MNSFEMKTLYIAFGEKAKVYGEENENQGSNKFVPGLRGNPKGEA
jgi:hypothetical protein